MAGTVMHERWAAGEFGLLSPHEALHETELFITNLQAASLLYSDHASNYAYVNGRIPEDKPVMFSTIHKLLAIPEESFRPPESGGL
jgi:hypothetical protein